MGVSCCFQIFEDPNQREKERQQYEERLRKIEEEKKLKEEEKKKKLEEVKNKFIVEMERNDLKILDNIEKLEPKYTDLYKPLPPNRKAKLSFTKKSFMAGPNEKMTKIETMPFSNYVIKIDEDKFGIMYYGDLFGLNKSFLDVHDFSTQKFLYRIRDINGDNIDKMKALKDGTFYLGTHNKNNSGIIKIIKDIGYQVLYNIYMEGSLYILDDERILTKKDKLLR